MADQPNTGEKANAGKQTNKPTQKLRRYFWRWFVLYMERKMHQRRARREKKKSTENPNDKAARWTAIATIWIAIFTVVLAGVGVLTLIEVIGGGNDTHNLAVAAANQAAWTQRLADSTKTQSDRTQTLADRMKDQTDRTKDVADKTKIVADQAVIQANAAKSAADTAKEALLLSERAYVFGVSPAVNGKPMHFNLNLINSGRLAAEEIHFTIFEETLGTDPVVFIEGHWADFTMKEILPSIGGPTNFITIDSPKGDATEVGKGTQGLIVAGTFQYTDGFPNTPERVGSFCQHTMWDQAAKSYMFVPCDADEAIAEIKPNIHYPNNKEAPFK